MHLRQVLPSSPAQSFNLDRGNSRANDLASHVQSPSATLQAVSGCASRDDLKSVSLTARREGGPPECRGGGVRTTQVTLYAPAKARALTEGPALHNPRARASARAFSQPAALLSLPINNRFF